MSLPDPTSGLVGDRYQVTVSFRLTPELRLTKLYQGSLRHFTASRIFRIGS
ncbi:hypothetical protein [Allocoleopsis sp.]|uniref:hypothetical protein n=1 Tax=Allocoleopsis sp. TaxID=3088169 RepID=UPI002FD2610B